MKRIVQLLGALAFATVVSSVGGTTALADPVTSAASKPANSNNAVAIAQALLDEMQRGRYDAVFARFDDNMKAHVSAEQLKSVWESLSPQMGVLQNRGVATVSTKDDYTMVSIPMVFAHGRLVARVVSNNASGQVTGFLIQPDTPPAPAARADLPSHEVNIGPAGRTLPGTLLLPKASSSRNGFPAVVLVHGSGPQDRDETVGGTRVFRDLAEGLADQGVASLRYEKRSLARPQDFGSDIAYTVDDETTDDAVAAVAFLRTRPEIDPDRIFVIGHSQGAMMAPRISQKSTQVAGLILMAAPARPLEDVLLDQVTYQAMDDGRIDEKERAQIDALKLAIAEVKKIDAHTPRTTKFILDLPASYWLSLQGYDPVAVAKSLRQPMLILQGDRDFQVTAPDWARWKSAFGANQRTTIKHYAMLSHLFVAGSGRGNIVEYSKPAHVEPEVIDDIAEWISRRK
jgi:dienelactone hydrolase